MLGSPRLMIGACLLLLLLNECHSQSTCNFMRQLSYLTPEMIPAEPAEADGLEHCNPLGGTCCTRQLEAEMEKQSVVKLNARVRDQVSLLRKFFDDSRRSFQAVEGMPSNAHSEHLQGAITNAHARLDSIYRQTYGTFYASQPPNSLDSPVEVFNDFFSRLDRLLHSAHPPSDTYAELDAIFGDLFNRTYVLEFLLMNPLVIDTDERQRQCMVDLIPALRPFGSMPEKIRLLLGRGLKMWTVFLSTLHRISAQLGSIAEKHERSVQKHSLPGYCSGPLTTTTQCHLCSGESVSTRPCFSLCLNILKGCLSALVEIDSQFNQLIDSLIEVSSRLKSVHNPYNLLLPLPFQISEAIMHFQELGTSYSNRIKLRCFQFDYRLRKQPALRERSRRSPSTHSDHPLRYPLRRDIRNDASAVTAMRAATVDFVDMLSRLRGLWKLLPRLFCHQESIAAADWEHCWNGSSIAPYTRGVARNGVQATRYNPEFLGLPEGAELDDSYHVENREFILISNQLSSLHNNEMEYTAGNDSAVPSLDLGSIPVDDEDYSYEGEEGSGDYDADPHPARHSAYAHRRAETYGNAATQTSLVSRLIPALLSLSQLLHLPLNRLLLDR